MPHSNHVENGRNGCWKGILRIKWAIQCKLFYSLAFSRRNYVHFDQFGGIAFEEMLVFLLSAKARRRCAEHSEAV